MPLRASERTSNSRAVATIWRFVLRRVSLRAFRTKRSSISMLVLLMEIVYTDLCNLGVCLGTSVLLFPGGDAQPAVIEFPVFALPQILARLAFDLADPRFQMVGADGIRERRGKHVDPVFESFLALFQFGWPGEQRRVVHFEAVRLEQTRIFGNAGVIPGGRC